MEREKTTKEIFKEMGIGTSASEIWMQIGFGAVLGIALLVFCAIGEYLNSLW